MTHMKFKSGRLKEANQSGERALKAEALRRKGAHGPTAKMKPPLAPRGVPTTRRWRSSRPGSPLAPRGVRAFPKPAASEGPAPARRYGKTRFPTSRLSQLTAKTDSPVCASDQASWPFPKSVSCTPAACRAPTARTCALFRTRIEK